MDYLSLGLFIPCFPLFSQITKYLLASTVCCFFPFNNVLEIFLLEHIESINIVEGEVLFIQKVHSNSSIVLGCVGVSVHVHVVVVVHEINEKGLKLRKKVEKNLKKVF